MTETESIYASITIVIMLFGYLAFHYLALYREKSSRFAVACNDFRVSLHEATSHIPEANKYWDNEILRSMPTIITSLELAVNKFKEHLSNKNKTSFIKEWANLKKQIEKQIPIAHSREELLYGGGTPMAKESKEKFHERLNNLLQHANET